MPVSNLSFSLAADGSSPRVSAAWSLVFAAWLAATAATLAALFLSEVVGIAPCVLCWYQRVFMFPLVLVLAAGLFPLDPKVVRYAFPLALGGWLIALFHVLLTYGVVPHGLAPCVKDIPCSRIEIQWFGFLTIPLASLFSFTAIGGALVSAHFKLQR